MQNYRLTLAYDGTRYRGWQRLPPPAKTVQASVETALGEIFGQPLEISGSGRTDAGVHAACQVASFHAPKRPTDEVLAQLKEDGCGQALLVPFMLVAGDHALNDMAGDGPKSWKSRLEAAGVGVRCRMRGLGALPEVQALYGARLREIV